MASSDDTSTRILNSAGPIFAKKGFKAATVREICAAAGVNGASVNYYFRDKERLYIETVKLAQQIRCRQVPMPIWPASTLPEAKLRDFIHTLVTRMVGARTAPWQTRLMMQELLRPSAACRELVQDYFRPDFELLLGILDEILPADTPLHRRQQLGFSVIGQCLYYRVAGEVIALLVNEEDYKNHYTVDDIADHVSQMCLAALGRLPPLATRPASDQQALPFLGAGREK